MNLVVSVLGFLALATQVPPSQDETLHLLQMSAPTASHSRDEISQKVGLIRSCEDARAMAATDSTLAIVENRSIRLSILPPEVQNLLRDLPIGQPTPIFGFENDVYRVLVICSREAVITQTGASV